MDSIKFVLKTFIIAVGLLAALQYPIEETTVEARTQNWIQSSEIGSQLKAVAQGAVRLAKDGYVFAEKKVRSFSEKSATGAQEILKKSAE